MAIPTVEEASNKLQEILSQIALNISPSDRSRISDELVSYAPVDYCLFSPEDRASN